MVNNLASVNSTLTTQIANLTHNITEKDMELTALRKIIEELGLHQAKVVQAEGMWLAKDVKAEGNKEG
eukprot:13851623-Ditylum_brightwellii.AAC.1